MSVWESKGATLTDISKLSAKTSETSSPESEQAPIAGKSGEPSPQAEVSVSRSRLAPVWARIVPFFASAFFFMSGIFTIFSPLPLIFLYFRRGRAWAWLALLTNSVVITIAGGSPTLALYLLFVGVLVIALTELLAFRKSFEKTAILTLVSMVFVGAASVLVYCRAHHLSPVLEFKSQVSGLVDTVVQTLNSANQDGKGAPGPSEADIQDWKQSFILEFPSAVAVFALVMIWASLVLVFRANPGQIRERLGMPADYLSRWRSPDWLVWPTIVSGACLIWDLGPVTDVGLNLFKFLMAIYAIQGLSVLAFFLSQWKVRGMFRAVGYAVAVFVMMPLLLSLGFFDLWFDFRAKFRQS